MRFQLYPQETWVYLEGSHIITIVGILQNLILDITALKSLLKITDLDFSHPLDLDGFYLMKIGLTKRYLMLTCLN